MSKFDPLKMLRERLARKDVAHVNREFYNVLSPNSPYEIVEAYRKLYANITYLPVENKCRKIVITSATAGEGKTTVAVNLAITLAQNLNNAKILLVDADMRKPGVDRMLSAGHPCRGLSEFLSGEDEKPNIVASSVEGLFVLYSGVVCENSTRLISSERMAELIRHCEESFDYIIMDTSALDASCEATLLKKHVNGYVLVAKSKDSDIDSIGTAIASLRTLGANIFGIVLTGEAPKRVKKRRLFRIRK